MEVKRSQKYSLCYVVSYLDIRILDIRIPSILKSMILYNIIKQTHTYTSSITFIYFFHTYSKLVMNVSDGNFIIGKSKLWRQGETSLVATVPKTLVENWKLQAGDILVFRLEDGKVVVEKEEVQEE